MTDRKTSKAELLRQIEFDQLIKAKMVARIQHQLKQSVRIVSNAFANCLFKLESKRLRATNKFDADLYLECFWSQQVDMPRVQLLIFDDGSFVQTIKC